MRGLETAAVSAVRCGRVAVCGPPSFASDPRARLGPTISPRHRRPWPRGSLDVGVAGLPPPLGGRAVRARPETDTHGAAGRQDHGCTDGSVLACCPQRGPNICGARGSSTGPGVQTDRKMHFP